MAFIKFSMILGSGTLLPLFVERSFALAASEGFLVSRQGECVEVQSLKRKVPDLGEIRDPSTFAKLMRDKGYPVTVNGVSTPDEKRWRSRCLSENCP